jgi:hypothetical protein
MKAQISMIAAPAAAMTLVKGALLAGTLLAFGPGAAFGAEPSKGATPYVTHFIFRPVQSLEVSGLGSATLLEAVGTTEKMKGEKMLDKMSARCTALNLDKSQPEMDCGTHIITGGTGKYAGITGSEPFSCISLPALAGEGGYTAMDIPHNTSWEIKK